MVQDLRSIDEVVIPLHSIVPNPYTLWTEVPHEVKCLIVLDCKDAFSFAFPFTLRVSHCLLLNGQILTPKKLPPGRSSQTGVLGQHPPLWTGSGVEPLETKIALRDHPLICR